MARGPSVTHHHEEPIMLGSKDAMATIAVRDIAAARTFYEGTLGLERVGPEQSGLAAYQAGGATVLVYQSQFAGTNQATSATWNLGRDVETIVQKLKGKGVQFEHYDNLPDIKREGDIHICGAMKAAWFKDPDGNIINLSGE
jgi:catechol 2,3-dioxygenase-like lactoylglutathione lyase family enzyme